MGAAHAPRAAAARVESGAHETSARPHHDARPDHDATAARPRRRTHECDGAHRRNLWLATDPESSPVGRLGGARARPVSKWRDAAGSGHHARGQHPCAPRHHAGRVGVATISATQWADPVVSTPVWGRWETHAAHRHRRPGPQTADCALALPGAGSNTRWCTAQAAAHECVIAAASAILELVRVPDNIRWVPSRNRIVDGVLAPRLHEDRIRCSPHPRATRIEAASELYALT